jgi:hypothetical protein
MQELFPPASPSANSVFSLTSSGYQLRVVEDEVDKIKVYDLVLRTS